MVEDVQVEGGTIAVEVQGEGPLIVLAHGIGDSHDVYRFLVPQLVAAGHRVAAVDLRGCGGSSASWPAWTQAAIAQDLLAVVRHLGGPAVLVGHSISGGAVTIAAATAPELVSAVVEICPFTRKPVYRLGDFAVARFRRPALRLMAVGLLGSPRAWAGYLDLAYPGVKPADWTAKLDRIRAALRDPERRRALSGMTLRSDAGASGALLAEVRRPVLVLMGSLDPDWIDPRAEGEAIVAALPAGVGRLAMIEGAGHYPQDQFPDAVAARVLEFLAAVHA